MQFFWSKTLNVGYGNKKNNSHKRVLDTTTDAKRDNIHWKLSLAVRHQAQDYEEYYFFRTPVRDQATKLVTGEMNQRSEIPNYVAANIGFIVSDGPAKPDKSHGRKFVSFPITINNDDIWNWHLRNRNNFNKKAFALFLNRRNKAQIDVDVSDFASLNIALNYYHAEQALINHMESPEFFAWLIPRLKEAGINPGHKIYGVILDIHSTREVCPHCQTMLEYLLKESSANGFLRWLRESLHNNGYLVSQKHPLNVSIRVSAHMQNGYGSDPIKPIVEYHDDEKGTPKGNGFIWLMQRHDHREFFSKSLLTKEIKCEELRQTLFCSGSEPIRRRPLTGSTSLACLWPEYSYHTADLQVLISSASSLVSLPIFNNTKRNPSVIVAEYLAGDQSFEKRKLKLEVAAATSLKPTYTIAGEELDIPLLVAEYADEKEQNTAPQLTC